MIAALRPALALVALTVTACASTGPDGPTPFFTSYSGDSEPTRPLFDIVDARMRREPGFVRDFGEPMQVHIGDGAPQADGRLRYQVRISIPSRLQNRRIGLKDRGLATFVVACRPDRPELCADAIIARARLQPARIRRIVQRSPKAQSPSASAGPHPVQR